MCLYMVHMTVRQMSGAGINHWPTPLPTVGCVSGPIVFTPKQAVHCPSVSWFRVVLAWAGTGAGGTVSHAL